MPLWVPLWVPLWNTQLFQRGGGALLRPKSKTNRAPFRRISPGRLRPIGSGVRDWKRRQEGERVKYRLNGNSAQFYDKAYSECGNVLRAETTLNTVQDFRVYRPK